MKKQIFGHTKLHAWGKLDCNPHGNWAHSNKVGEISQLLKLLLIQLGIWSNVFVFITDIVSRLDGELISFAASHTGANLRAPEMQVNYTCSKPVASLEFSLLTSLLLCFIEESKWMSNEYRDYSLPPNQ